MPFMLLLASTCCRAAAGSLRSSQVAT